MAILPCIDILPSLKGPEGKRFLRGQVGCSFGGFLLLTAYIAVHFTG
jgi:hypothetical protein